MEHAFFLLYRWSGARGSDRTVFGPRFAVYPAVVQLSGGRPGLDVGRALRSDENAIDRLCRLALSAYDAWSATPDAPVEVFVDDEARVCSGDGTFAAGGTVTLVRAGSIRDACRTVAAVPRSAARVSDVGDGAGPLAVSVVMPAFNEAEILESTVADVVDSLRRRDGSFELVVCENGSTDDTLAIAADSRRSIAEVDVQHLPDADYGAALHAGLRAARGEVVVNFDVDHYDMGFLDLAVARDQRRRRTGDRRRVETQRGRATTTAPRCASWRRPRSRSSCARCSASASPTRTG